METIDASSPGGDGVQEVGGDTGAGGRNAQVEDRVGDVVDAGEFAGVDGIEDCAGVLERAAAAATGAAGADPASVEQPGVGAV